MILITFLLSDDVTLLIHSFWLVAGWFTAFFTQSHTLNISIWFYFPVCYHTSGDFPGGTVVKNSLANAGDTRDSGSIPGLGRSPGVGKGNSIQ